MVENCIGTMELPIGIAPNFVINGKHYLVPFCVEEPSIIAACSSISKLVAKNGGFTADYTSNIMIGQIQILDINDNDKIDEIKAIIMNNQDKYIEIGNTFCESMKKRGGGVVKIEVRTIKPRNINHNMIPKKLNNNNGNGMFTSSYLSSHQNRSSYIVVHVHVCEIFVFIHYILFLNNLM